MSRDCFVTLPRGVKCLSAVCDCGISWSYSLTIPKNHFTLFQLRDSTKFLFYTITFTYIKHITNWWDIGHTGQRLCHRSYRSKAVSQVIQVKCWVTHLWPVWPVTQLWPVWLPMNSWYVWYQIIRIMSLCQIILKQWYSEFIHTNQTEGFRFCLNCITKIFVVGFLFCFVFRRM